MIHKYTEINCDNFVRFFRCNEKCSYFIWKEYRGINFGATCDVVDDVITIKIFFLAQSGHIWYQIEAVLLFWHFQNGRHFQITTNTLLEVIPEIDYTSKITMNISKILSFWWMLWLKYQGSDDG